MGKIRIAKPGFGDGGQPRDIGFYFGNLASTNESTRELTFPFDVHVIDFKLATEGDGKEQWVHVGKSSTKQKIEKAIINAHPVGKFKGGIIDLHGEYLPGKDFVVASFEAVEVTQQKIGGSFKVTLPRGVEFYDCFNVNDDLFQSNTGWEVTVTASGGEVCGITATTYGVDFYSGKGGLKCATLTAVNDDAYGVCSLYDSISLQPGKVYRAGVFVYVSDWGTKTAEEQYIFGLKDASGVTVLGIQLDADGTYLRVQGVYPTGASTTGKLLSTGTSGEHIIDLDKWHYLELELDLRVHGQYKATLYLENLTDGGVKTLQASASDLSLTGSVPLTETVKCGILDAIVGEARGWYTDSMSFWNSKE